MVLVFFRYKIKIVENLGSLGRLRINRFVVFLELKLGLVRDLYNYFCVKYKVIGLLLNV